jgi:drug/metabolite transporter (DMT)-like permease
MSLVMGIFAALIWGLHDLVVRIVSPRGAVAPLLFTALLAGAVLLAPVALLFERGGSLTPGEAGLALLSGIAFAAAGVGLYRSFAIGPVRVAAPICGSYPVLSLAFAALQGRATAAWEWLAVLTIVAGLALAASGTEGEAEAGPRGAAVMWALLGPWASPPPSRWRSTRPKAGGELTVTLLARVAALACVGRLVLCITRSACSVHALCSGGPLALLGALDATAIGLVVAAARFPSPEYAAVASSVFGLVTIFWPGAAG